MKQTILFGNGINRVCNEEFEWSNVLEEIRGVSFTFQDSVPYTFQYEDILISKSSVGDFSSNEQTIKQRVIKYLNARQTAGNGEIYEQLFSIPADYFLTTNYDLAYQIALQNNGFSLRDSNNNELAYSMRRWSKWVDQEKRRQLQIWQIHGTINAKDSIMLGFDHYSGNISRLYNYLNNGAYTRVEPGKVNEDLKHYKESKSKLPYILYRISHLLDKIQLIYWADTFFMSDVHIIGNALSFAEIDLWWILNKRMRLMKNHKGIIKNMIYYYGYTEESIKHMLASYGVDVSYCTTTEPQKDDWEQFYVANIEQINNNVRKNKQ